MDEQTKQARAEAEKEAFKIHDELDKFLDRNVTDAVKMKKLLDLLKE